MSTGFGPQLIGETEKTLDALLHAHLDGTGLTEPQWVTLRIADVLGGTVDRDGLAASVAERAHFRDAGQLVDALAARGLLDRGTVTDAGRALMTRVQASLGDDVASIFGDLPADDVVTTERVLNQVAERARLALAR
jgi:hypothetical protein